MLSSRLMSLIILFASFQSSAQVVQNPDPILWNYSGAGGTQVITYVHDPVESWSGSVNIYDETSSEPWLTIRSPRRFDLFGAAKSSASDIDGDGFDDIIIGAPLTGSNDVNPGRVYVYSGATGQELLQIQGFGKDDFFGRSVAGAGDTDGDGVPDLLVAGWYHSKRGVPYGRVYLLSGADGKLLRTITSYEAEDGFGYTIASLGDLNGDGIHEIAIAAPLASTSHLGSGSVYVFDLADAPYKHVTTSNATSTIYNSSASRDYFGSILAYDDQVSTSGFDVILIGSIDTVSYDINSAQFVFSHHKINGNQASLGSTSVPGQLVGDAIPDGKVSATDVNAATLSGGGIDVDGDGLVTVSDVALVISNFGQSSPVQDLLSDPSPILSRMAELTTGGQFNVIPSDPQPWDGPGGCDDDDDSDDDDSDDDDDDSDDDGSNTRPDVQPPFPGARPWDDNGNHIMSPPDDSSADDDCDDDDDDGDPDDDDGGPDCGCQQPDDGEGGDCNAFLEVSNARYVGKGLESDEFFASVTSEDWVATLRLDPDSEIGATVLQAASNNSLDYSAVVKFDDESGICKLRWVATNVDTGVVYRRCFSVNVEEYQTVDFKYQSFISCGAVKTPYRWASAYTLPPYFGGDADRFNCDINATNFGTLVGQTQRSSYHVFIECDGEISSRSSIEVLSCDDDELNYTNGELLDSGIYPRWGLTRAFAADQIQNACGGGGSGGLGGNSRCEYDLIDGATPLANPEPDSRQYSPLVWEHHNSTQDGSCLYQALDPTDLNEGNNGGYSLRVEPNKVIFRYFLHGSDPLIPFDLAPAIDVFGGELELTWDVDRNTGVQTVHWVANFEHDPFPAHQMLIDDERVMGFDPTVPGYGLFSLAPIGDNVIYSNNGSVHP